jgi:hypothetical protein
MWQHFSDSVPDNYEAPVSGFAHAYANAHLSGFDVDRV